MKTTPTRSACLTFCLFAFLLLSGCQRDDGENPPVNVAPPPACPAGQQWNGQACASGSPCPAGQQWDGRSCAATSPCPTGQQWDGRTCVANSPPPDGTNSGDGAAVAIASAGSRPAASPVAPALSAVAEPLIQARASQVSPGATPVGAVVAGQFQPGQALETILQMEPGKCYTVIAEAVPGGITELNIEMLPALGLPNVPVPVIAVDKSTGPSAVLGAHPNCQRWAIAVPTPMKVVVWAAAGQGVAAAQIYAK